MPFLLAWRAVRNLLLRKRYRGQIPRVLPALLFVACLWMAGEFVGYLTGSPGRLAPGRAVAAQPALQGKG